MGERAVSNFLHRAHAVHSHLGFPARAPLAQKDLLAFRLDPLPFKELSYLISGTGHRLEENPIGLLRLATKKFEHTVNVTAKHHGKAES